MAGSNKYGQSLEEIRLRFEETTQEEWVAEIFPSLEEAQEEGGFEWASPGFNTFDDKPVGAVWKRDPERGGTTGLPGNIEASAADAIFIATAHQDVPHLLEQLKLKNATINTLHTDRAWIQKAREEAEENLHGAHKIIESMSKEVRGVRAQLVKAERELQELRNRVTY